MDETNIELATLDGPHSTATQGELLETKTLAIAGITTDRCLRVIEKALRSHPGVRALLIDLENATAAVTFDTRVTNLAELHEVLIESGYKPSRRLAEA